MRTWEGWVDGWDLFFMPISARGSRVEYVMILGMLVLSEIGRRPCQKHESSILSPVR